MKPRGKEICRIYMDVLDGQGPKVGDYVITSKSAYLVAQVRSVTPRTPRRDTRYNLSCYRSTLDEAHMAGTDPDWVKAGGRLFTLKWYRRDPRKLSKKT